MEEVKETEIKKARNQELRRTLNNYLEFIYENLLPEMCENYIRYKNSSLNIIRNYSKKIDKSKLDEKKKSEFLDYLYDLGYGSYDEDELEDERKQLEEKIKEAKFLIWNKIGKDVGIKIVEEALNNRLTFFSLTNKTTNINKNLK